MDDNIHMYRSLHIWNKRTFPKLESLMNYDHGQYSVGRGGGGEQKKKCKWDKPLSHSRNGWTNNIQTERLKTDLYKSSDSEHYQILTTTKQYWQMN